MKKLLCLLLPLLLIACEKTSYSIPALDNTTVLVVPWGKNGGTAQMARAIKPDLEKTVGPVQIVYMPGGSGRVGIQLVYDNKGPVIAGGAPSSLTVRNVLGEWNLTASDFLIATVWQNAPVVVVHKESQYNDIGQLIKALLSKKLKVATAGEGSAGHRAIEAISDVLGGVSYEHLTYDSGTVAVEAVAKKEADISTQLASEAAEQIRTGYVKPLAIATTSKDDVVLGEYTVPQLAAQFSEPLPVLAATFGLMVRKDQTELYAKIEAAIGGDLSATKMVAKELGVVMSPHTNEAAQRAINPEIRATAWTLESQGKAKVNPSTLGIAKP